MLALVTYFSVLELRDKFATAPWVESITGFRALYGGVSLILSVTFLVFGILTLK